MSISEYYRILGLHHGCTTEEIKKAYRNKAREYHPDINHDPAAKDMFILATEAYEFLLTYADRAARDAEAYNRAMEDWRKYRQARSRHKAKVYARTSYVRFRNTKFYKSTKIFDGTTVIFSFIVSGLVLVIAVAGYIFRIHHPIPGMESPSIWVMFGFILFGMMLFFVSFINYKAFIQSTRKRKDNK
ncbi:MAG: J domain-containing protein [Bacteroidales bacterium]